MLRLCRKHECCLQLPFIVHILLVNVKDKSLFYLFHGYLDWSMFLFVNMVLFTRFKCDWDSLLVRAPDSWSKGFEFESWQKQRDNFLLQSQLCMLTLIRCPFHPRVTAVARKRPRSFSQKCRWQVTPKYAYTLDSMKSEWADYATAQA